MMLWYQKLAIAPSSNRLVTDRLLLPLIKQGYFILKSILIWDEQGRMGKAKRAHQCIRMVMGTDCRPLPILPFNFGSIHTPNRE